MPDDCLVPFGDKAEFRDKHIAFSQSGDQKLFPVVTVFFILKCLFYNSFRKFIVFSRFFPYHDIQL